MADQKGEELTVEEVRLRQDTERKVYWKKWGPYLSERQWSTVREDYSNNGDAWSYFPHEHARSRTFRWGEDGIAGFSDTHALQCVAFAFWNEKDDYLKERLFGLAGPQGNHGEDVKEEYFYVDNTPTHSYMNYLYKYPQKKYPYEQLLEENGRRSREVPEFELVDTGVLAENRYFDIFVETAKDADDPETIHFRVTAYNRGPEPAPLHILPTVWFRNTWTWDQTWRDGKGTKPEVPSLEQVADGVIKTEHKQLGTRYYRFNAGAGGPEGATEAIEPELIFTENETNKSKLYGPSEKNCTPFVKDAFHEYVVDGNKEAVNPEKKGTKSAAWYSFEAVEPGQSVVVRLTQSTDLKKTEIDETTFNQLFEDRLDEADEFYYKVSPLPLSDELRVIQRQAFAGMLWSKQYYQFIWEQWAHGDKGGMPPPPERINLRNREWRHLHIDDILSMPDKWEYPFFAAWDTAFHCVPIAMVDAPFAKKQLDLMTREWYMHPNGQLPAYEWNYSDVNPPVHAWATFRVFKLERRMTGIEDIDFLERVFQKLLLNFTWWVNRKDSEGRNVFQGGFLGLDNIGLFNRSEPLPTGGELEQADGTGWMGFYCLQMLNIALELSKTRPVYEDIASKFFEHFIFIADAMSYRSGSSEESLWDEEEGFFFDVISWGNGHSQTLPVRSLVGLIPLYASLTIDSDVLVRYPKFARRVEWFIENRPELAARNMASLSARGEKNRLLLSLVNRERLERIMVRMLDEEEFLSDYGIRSMSKYHKEHPYSMTVNGQTFSVDYQPGDSNSGMFGGNSNWRGPVWFPVNFLLIESLQRFFLFYGRDLKVECPTGSGNQMDLAKVAENLQHRLIKLFTRNTYKENRIPYNGGVDLFDFDEHYDYLSLFYEFFDPDTGRGLGTKHQNGWTGLVAKLIHDTGMSLTNPKTFGEDPTEAAKEFFDDVFETSRPRSRHHSRSGPLLRRRTSTHRVVENINTLLERYNMREDDLVQDLESHQGN